MDVPCSTCFPSLFVLLWVPGVLQEVCRTLRPEGTDTMATPDPIRGRPAGIFHEIMKTVDHSKESKALHDLHLKTLSEIFGKDSSSPTLDFRIYHMDADKFNVKADALKTDNSAGKLAIKEEELQDLLTSGATRLYRAETALKSLLEFHLEIELRGCTDKADENKIGDRTPSSVANPIGKDADCSTLKNLKYRLEQELEKLRKNFADTCQQLRDLQISYQEFAAKLNNSTRGAQ
ncbi:uncharacterized protein [Narcine bancroftii]|uniref:uncharacterized protein isoform X12 n=1 Tax=Narcine bancroftii TaxID=1343680 RepID=UPI0038314FEE